MFYCKLSRHQVFSANIIFTVDIVKVCLEDARIIVNVVSDIVDVMLHTFKVCSVDVAVFAAIICDTCVRPTGHSCISIRGYSWQCFQRLISRRRSFYLGGNFYFQYC